jgi:hypothetical protein
MALKLVIDDKHKDRGGQLVALDPRHRRLGLYKGALELMIRYNGGPFEHVQIFVDPEAPNKFWLKPCEGSADGARKLYHSSRSTRGLSVSRLLQELDAKLETTLRFPLVWDEEHSAGRVDLGTSNRG